jgi:two-component system chemotaxis response regulator CheY
MATSRPTVMSETKVRVLVVDDSAFMRTRISRHVGRAGMEVVGEARDGGEAAKLYTELRPDLVTMDLTMRGHDGLAGTEMIRQIDPRAKVVLFSIVEDPQLIEQAHNVGVEACVHKSKPKELVACLQRLSATA